MSETSPTIENELVVAEPLLIERKLPVRHRGAPPFFWVLIGAGVGVAGTVAAFASRPEPLPRVLVRPSPVVQNTQPPAAGAAMPLASTPGTVVATKTEPDAPMNPFGGSSFVLPKVGGQPAQKTPQPPALTGMILPKNLPIAPMSAPVLPLPSGIEAFPKPGGKYLNKLIAQGLPKAPTALKAERLLSGKPSSATSSGPKSTLVTVSQLANDRQGAADELIAYAQKAGGKAQSLSEQGSDGKPEIKGVLATVPEAAVPDLLKHVAATGGVVDKQTWTGSSDERKSRLVEDASARLASLKKLREALLVTYLEDAQPVKDVDDEIAKANKSLTQLQTDKGTEKMAIVRISFVKG